MTYESLGRRAGYNNCAGAQARHVPVDAHLGGPDEFVDRLEQAASDAANGKRCQEFLANVFRWATDTRNLFAAWTYLRQQGGPAPGIDGLTYRDLDKHLTWELLRDVHESLLAEDYVCLPLLQQTTRKPSGGIRLLELPTVIDRTVGRAVVQAIQPYLDTGFSADSFGFRPRLERVHALARVNALATRTDRWIWVEEDVRNAFPSIPRERLLQIVQARLQNERLTNLVGRLTNNGRSRGIPQGQPICPLLLNVYLDHLLDRHWPNDLGYLIRYADNLLLLCGDWKGALETRARLDQALRPTGMRLKGTPEASVIDLAAGRHVTWLGYRISREAGQLRVEIAPSSWKKLETSFDRVQLEPEPPLRALLVVNSWIRQMGPALGELTAPAVIQRLLELGHRYGFEELPSRGELLEACRQAYERWIHLREQSIGQDA